MLVAQSCQILCNPVDCSPPGSSVHGNLQARILGWVSIPFSRGSSQPREDSLPSEPPGKISQYAAAAAKLLQSCPTLCDPIDGSPPGSSVPGILQARIEYWSGLPFPSPNSQYTKGENTKSWQYMLFPFFFFFATHQ